jgi:thiamine-phosphate diphosphorylase
VSFVLYLIADDRSQSIEATAAALRAAPGRVGVQARIEGASAGQLAALGAALLAICRAASAPLLINDRADVARAIGADGVQLPEAGLTVAQARMVGMKIVGRSCHDRAGLERAAADGADFATLAPIFEVPGKGPPIGAPRAQTMVRGIALPVYALGGIDADNAGELRGVHGIAVIRGVYDAPDPAEAVRAILARFAPA